MSETPAPQDDSLSPAEMARYTAIESAMRLVMMQGQDGADIGKVLEYSEKIEDYLLNGTKDKPLDGK